MAGVVLKLAVAARPAIPSSQLGGRQVAQQRARLGQGHPQVDDQGVRLGVDER